MISEFSARNFKCIKNEVSLTFEPSKDATLADYYLIEPAPGIKLLKLGLLYGPNASGKTTVLKALDFLRKLVTEPVSKKSDRLDFSPFMMDRESRNTPTEFVLSFYHQHIKYLYEIKFNQQAIVSEALHFHDPNKALVFKRDTNFGKEFAFITFGSKIKINQAQKAALEANTLWNNTVLGGYLKTNFDAPELKAAQDWFSNTLNELILSDTNLFNYVSSRIESGLIAEKKIIEILKKADFKISDIAIKPNTRLAEYYFESFFEARKKEISNEILKDNIAKFLSTNNLDYYDIPKSLDPELTFNHQVKLGDGKEDTFPINYNDESQGTQRYFQLAGLLDLLLKGKRIYCIDELESSLHPDLFKHFLLVFLANANQSQLIATTHHRELLLERDILRHDAIWFTDKLEDGSMELYSLDDFDTSVVRKDTGSIFNAYKSGKLGANPQLKDYYIELE